MPRSKYQATRVVGGTLLCWGLAACVGGNGTSEVVALREVLEAEDARPTMGARLTQLTDGTGAADRHVRHFSVRALGRLENPEIIPFLVGALEDDVPEIRGAAARALAQAVQGRSGEAALGPLLDRAGREDDALVRGEIAHALGRLQLEDGDALSALDRVLALGSEGGSEPRTLLGVAMGLEAMTRAVGPAGADLRLYEWLTRSYEAAPDFDAEDPTLERVRTVAITALGQRGRLTDVVARTALSDPAPTVRAAALRFLGSLEEGEREQWVFDALSDPEVIVRIEAVNALDGAIRTSERCRALLAISREGSFSGVQLVAVDAMQESCPEPEATEIRQHLRGLAANGLRSPNIPWSWPSRALSALASLDPEAARVLLPAHAEHENPFVRAAAARVADRLAERPVLDRLAADPDPNVRTAAFPGLFALDGHAIDDRLIAELDASDPQLLITVAGLLEESSRAEIAPAGLAALARLTAARRDTWRDPRIALLSLVDATGGPDAVARLRDYLTDYDPEVASRTAAILTDHTGETHRATPEPLAPEPLPSVEELAALRNTRVELHMTRGGVITLEPLPLVAPTNAHRFVRRVEEGYFDGLTFHRWAPNFVIQGGSPDANEYAGEARYTRDEIGPASHWRGTVGISTRGRDTGDGQIFVNLIDNLRLDHEYTVFAHVVGGLEVVDLVLPGDVIERAEVVRDH